ncbi:hypothetical protein ACIRPT_03025 [Streptomyces sp. NPDC101227]|uniref:hypothetical protein n=1 Tax=Streptomyces sp. NPDC101227 TaxID=3366136 RepID=UPI00380F7299
MNNDDQQPKMTLPIQAPPVQRDDRSAQAATPGDNGIEAARCADLTGLARQMCFARGGLSL